MRAWIMTYYVANRYSQMNERQRMYGASLSEAEVRNLGSKLVANLQRKGVPVYPNFDVENKLVA